MFLWNSLVPRRAVNQNCTQRVTSQPHPYPAEPLCQVDGCLDNRLTTGNWPSLEFLMHLTSFDRRHKARRWCWGYRRLKAQIQIPHGNWMCPISRDSTSESLHTTPNRLDVSLSSHDRDETRGKNQGLRGRQLLWKVWNALATSDSTVRDP